MISSNLTKLYDLAIRGAYKHLLKFDKEKLK